MSIDGTYAFVYSGVNGLGVGIFTVAAEKFEGVDFVGGRYTGTYPAQARHAGLYGSGERRRHHFHLD